MSSDNKEVKINECYMLYEDKDGVHKINDYKKNDIPRDLCKYIKSINMKKELYVLITLDEEVPYDSQFIKFDNDLKLFKSSKYWSSRPMSHFSSSRTLRLRIKFK